MDNEEIISLFLKEYNLLSLKEKRYLNYFIFLNFRNQKNYQWRVEKYKSFIQRNSLDYKVCYEILANYDPSYFDYSKNRGKLFEKFLAKIKRFNEKSSDPLKTSSLKIPLKRTKYRYEGICEYISLLKKYTELPMTQILKYTYRNVETNLTWSTFRVYYYENRFYCK